MMAQVQVESCSTYVKAQFEANLCFVRMKKCSLFSNKHKGMASMSINIL